MILLLGEADEAGETAAKITWKSSAYLEILQLSDTGVPSIPTVMATYAQLLWGELVSS